MKKNKIRCKDCKYLMFSDCYGECRKGIFGIVSPEDSCGRGELVRTLNKEKDGKQQTD